MPPYSQHPPHAVDLEPMPLPETLKIVSYNIQVGVDTRQFRDYLTQSWKHLLPHRERLLNLERIAHMLKEYDLVGLQEVDSGSLRSGFVDMTEYLAHRGGFPHWYRQVNRNIGMLAQHSNGFLSRYEALEMRSFRLPGGPGRGAMLLEFAGGTGRLAVCTAHLALSRRSRQRQLDFLGELVSGYRNLIVMGDLNTPAESLELRRFLQRTSLHEPAADQLTFPSWRPRRKIDHIFVSDSLTVKSEQVLDYPLSDHLPIAVEIALPDELRLAA
jgi:endonuclease/exonuclease/phosphatase family metal-dependent hydrolase